MVTYVFGSLSSMAGFGSMSAAGRRGGFGVDMVSNNVVKRG
jgi:hypothetical protein